MNNSIKLETIGFNLKKYRLRKALTVDQVREYLHLESVQAIYKWEKGKCLPQAENLLLLMHLYDVRAEDLIYVEDNDSGIFTNTSSQQSAATIRIAKYFDYLAKFTIENKAS